MDSVLCVRVGVLRLDLRQECEEDGCWRVW